MNWKKCLSLIGIAILIYLVYSIGINELIESLKGIRIIYVLFSFIISTALLLLFAIKWDILLKGQGMRLKTKDMLNIFLTGWVYGILTPGRIGSFLRIKFLKDKTGKSLGFCSSSVILDRIIDTTCLFFLAFLGSLFIIKNFSNLYILFSVLIVVIIAGTIIILNRNLTRFFIKRAYKLFIPKKFKMKTKEVFDSFYDHMPSKKSIILSLVLSILVWFATYSQGYLLALALNIEIPFISYSLLYPIAGVISMLPITISGFGTREAALIVLFSQYSIPAAKIVSMSLLGTILNMYIPALLVLLLIKK